MSFHLDPRSRLALTVLYAVFIITSRRPMELFIGLGGLWLAILAAGESRQYLRWLRLVAAMAITWFAIALWAFDLAIAATASLRLVALTSAFFLFFRTTAPEDLGNALVQMGLPYSVAFILSTSLQFVPIISRKAQNIVDAQRSRGIPLEPGPAAVRHIPALLAPLLIQAFQLADELAEAMESRGFGRAGRTFMHDYRLRLADWLVLVGAVAVLAASTLIR
ncbi:MAG: energy-coupling factor transporter transmembrane protein EcfT [Ardenticatenaceae bacterium]|nr:energy-coupling factor transporter transmembrane protein EcfT [Ardenticatenaceae bacterium]HBY92490.1 energy-coupling factor transporter transmembrane protein EcfT [Chloroflexota bacterium]